MTDDDFPVPNRERLDAALKAAQFAADNCGALSKEELAEIVEAAKWARHTLPPDCEFLSITTRNPLNQVYFRAGLLACREYMARFVEQGGDTLTAQSIRANWWPQLGDDPGPPRLFDFDEIATEIEEPDGKVRWESKDVPISVEALPRAYHFVNSGQ